MTQRESLGTPGFTRGKIRIPDAYRIAVFAVQEYALKVDRQAHWDQVYTTRPAEELSWFQQQPALSIELIERAGVGRAAAVIDIGGGDSRLVDGLLELSYENLTVLDVSQAALERAQRRLGDKAVSVQWVASDVTH